MGEDEIAMRVAKALEMMAEGLALMALATIATSDSLHATGHDGAAVWGSASELLVRAKEAQK